MKFIFISSATLAVLLFAGQAPAADGQEVYSNNCAVCHAAMPPKLGDKAAWGPLIKAMFALIVEKNQDFP